MISLTGWDVFVKESGIQLVGVLGVYESDDKPYIWAVKPTGEVAIYRFSHILLKRPQPAEPEPTPKHPHTELLERLVEECKRFEKQLNGDNSWYIATFDVGIGTALKAAQDALENNQ